MDPQQALAEIVWLEPAQNPFGIRVLDCRPFCTTMISTTQNQQIALTFLKYRTSDGREHQGRQPPNLLGVQTSLVYPHSGGWPADGRVFTAAVMEDKWDISLHSDYLYFARSWTGDLQFRARVEFTANEVIITGIEANADVVENDPEFAVQLVDFLIKSHAYDFQCPHPGLPSLKDSDNRQIVFWSFQIFGRRGCFATFEKSTAVRIPGGSGTFH